MMARTRTGTKSTDSFEMARAMAEAVLHQAGVKGVVPTPLDEVARVVGIHDVLDIGYLNEVQRDLHRRRRSPGVLLRRFVGAVSFEHKVVLLDTSKPDEMRRWTQAHELAHKLLPWHEGSSYLDDDWTLSPQAKEQKEREANVGGAHLLFQGSQFWNESLSYKQGLAVPLTLAGPYGASLTSTIRYWVETHPDPVGLVCATRYVQNRSIKIIYSDQSPSFAARFGVAAGLFPSRLPLDDTPLTPSVCAAVRLARSSHSIGFGEMPCGDLNGQAVGMDVETFFNGYNVFVLVMPHRRVALGRRLRVERNTLGTDGFR